MKAYSQTIKLTALILSKLEHKLRRMKLLLGPFM